MRPRIHAAPPRAIGGQPWARACGERTLAVPALLFANPIVARRQASTGRRPRPADPAAASEELARERRLLEISLASTPPAPPRRPAWAAPLRPASTPDPRAATAAVAVREGMAAVVRRVRRAEARLDAARSGAPAKVSFVAVAGRARWLPRAQPSHSLHPDPHSRGSLPVAAQTVPA